MFNWIKKPQPQPAKKTEPEAMGFFSTDIPMDENPKGYLARAMEKTFQKKHEDMQAVNEIGEAFGAGTFAMDSGLLELKLNYAGGNTTIPEAQLGWYASQGFIGYQTCAVLSQNWLVDKACSMPARDAARNGYDLTSSDGTELSPDIIDYIAQQDKKYGISNHCVQHVRNGRIFGIRVSMFKIQSDDPDYYSKPFNIDGIKPNSYKGISQIDPYWITPELDLTSASDPSSMHFYEPTWWRINGKRVHRSHLIIMRNGEVPDILKPSYIYGGIPVPQKLAERIYAAERTANEAPMLAMSKRLTALKVDMSQIAANPNGFKQKMAVWTNYMNNYGVKVIGGNEEVQQFDTALGDLDAIIMTQYQLVAAAAEVPATKLLGTSPKGFNATGEFEEASYNQFLESIQYHDMSPLVERHHQILIRSNVCPKFSCAPFETSIVWNSVDSHTAKEQAEINLIKAQTDAQYIATGAIDGVDVRGKIIADKYSGYNGLSQIVDDMPVGDGYGMDGDHWITTETGSHILIDDDGTVKGGAGGSLAGKKLERAKSSTQGEQSKTQAAKSPAETDVSLKAAKHAVEQYIKTLETSPSSIAGNMQANYRLANIYGTELYSITPMKNKSDYEKQKLNKEDAIEFIAELHRKYADQT